MCRLIGVNKHIWYFKTNLETLLENFNIAWVDIYWGVIRFLGKSIVWVLRNRVGCLCHVVGWVLYVGMLIGVNKHMWYSKTKLETLLENFNIAQVDIYWGVIKFLGKSIVWVLRNRTGCLCHTVGWVLYVGMLIGVNKHMWYSKTKLETLLENFNIAQVDIYWGVIKFLGKSIVWVLRNRTGYLCHTVGWVLYVDMLIVVNKHMWYSRTKLETLLEKFNIARVDIYWGVIKFLGKSIVWVLRNRIGCLCHTVGWVLYVGMLIGVNKHMWYSKTKLETLLEKFNIARVDIYW
jgi:hypothetical protein